MKSRRGFRWGVRGRGGRGGRGRGPRGVVRGRKRVRGAFRDGVGDGDGDGDGNGDGDGESGRRASSLPRPGDGDGDGRARRMGEGPREARREARGAPESVARASSIRPTARTAEESSAHRSAGAHSGCAVSHHTHVWLALSPSVLSRLRSSAVDMGPSRDPPATTAYHSWRREGDTGGDPGGGAGRGARAGRSARAQRRGAADANADGASEGAGRARASRSPTRRRRRGVGAGSYLTRGSPEQQLANTGNSRAGRHVPIPSRHTSVSPLKSPHRSCARSTRKLCGPCLDPRGST